MTPPPGHSVDPPRIDGTREVPRRVHRSPAMLASNLDLPFDQFQRYELVRLLVESVRADGQRFRILDVGGRTALLRDFLPDDDVDLVDVDPSDARGLVLGSGAQLPFKDDAYDVVAGFDTLEHVPPPLRDAFVAECARVARRHVILAGPYHAEPVAEAEQALLDFLKVRLQWEHRYLAEHRVYGLPDMGRATEILEGAGCEVLSIGHGALDRWLPLMIVELYAEHEPLLRSIAARAYRLYNEHLFRTDHGGQVYRHALVGVLNGAPRPTLEGALEPPGSAPREASEALVGFGQEVLRYDALRDSYQPEMERLHGVVKSLEHDLEEHKKTLATVSEDLRQSKATIDALRQEAERERSESGAVLADREERLGAVTADLETHRKVQVELRSLHEAAAKEIEVRGAELDRLRAQVGEYEGTINDLNGQLSAQNEELISAHDRLGEALEHLRSSSEEASAARTTLAGALRRDSEPAPAADPAELTLAEEVTLLVQACDQRLLERDQAQEQLFAMAAELAREREMRETLAAELGRPWARLGRLFSRRRVDLSPEE